jgi:hypothetical protein
MVDCDAGRGLIMAVPKGENADGVRKSTLIRIGEEGARIGGAILVNLKLKGS